MSNNLIVKTCEDDNSELKVLSYPYIPDYCNERHGMFLHVDEKLVKVGDKFATLEDFVNYLNDNAKRWCFYYKCSDSHKPSKGRESYLYSCIYRKNREKYNNRGLKRRFITRTDCPCKIKIRHINNEEELTVIFVCNHHDHALSQEEFYKLRYRKRLPPYIREDVIDFLNLGVDFKKITAYVEMETGFTLSRPFLHGLGRRIRIKNIKHHLTRDRIKILLEKINSVHFKTAMIKDDQNEQAEICDNDEEDTPKTSEQTQIEKSRNARKTSTIKRSTEIMDESINTSKRCRIEGDHQISLSNDMEQSVERLEELIKCETQTNPTQDDTDIYNTIHIKDQGNSENGDNVKYIIEYYDPDNNSHVREIISNELCEVIDDDIADDIADDIGDDNSGDYVPPETVITDDNCHNNETIIINENGIEEIQNQEVIINEDETVVNTEDYCIQNVNESLVNGEMEANSTNENGHIEEDNIGNIDTEAVVYMTECDEDIVEYVSENDGNANDVGVQTNVETTNSVVPVFDVYMKDGNVTGFVVNDNNLQALRDAGVDKEIQTSEDAQDNGNTSQLDINDEHCDTEIIYEKSDGSPDTMTKHEYVHRNNIHKYMVQRNFPKYLKILARETNIDVMKMLRNVYREKGMFKMTTTQRGKEGNTMIWYMAERPKFRTSDSLNDVEVTLLKEKIQVLEKQNSDLIEKNKYLADVALKLLNGT